MTIIPFAQQRFTPADVSMFIDIAMHRREGGLWDSWTRESRKDDDSFYVFFAHNNRAIYRFSRDSNGTYELFFNDQRTGWYRFSHGDSAEECLSVWSTSRTLNKKAS